jgi:excinuclease ABC subunit A
MGPEGGSGGGLVVAEGTPEEVAEVDVSHTGRFLKEVLAGRGRFPAPAGEPAPARKGTVRKSAPKAAPKAAKASAKVAAAKAPRPKKVTARR